MLFKQSDMTLWFLGNLNGHLEEELEVDFGEGVRTLYLFALFYKHWHTVYTFQCHLTICVFKFKLWTCLLTLNTSSFSSQVSPSVAKLILVHFHWQISQVLDRYVPHIHKFCTYFIFLFNYILVHSVLHYTQHFYFFLLFFCTCQLL